jgi:large subunit ribosomal protein L15
MNLSELPTLVARNKKRLGRGHGSGRGKTAGRGTKGQKARGTVPQDFEGGQLSITKRLPLMRGKGRNKSRHVAETILTLGKLSKLPKGTVVTVESLKKNDLIDSDVHAVKILGDGEISVALTVQVACSKSAKAAIEKAGGTVTV